MTGTRERPILFSAPMIRAILEGRKTQTRRVARFDEATLAALAQTPSSAWSLTLGYDGYGGLSRTVNGGTLTMLVRFPYGHQGTRLWVRETWTHDAPDLETCRSAYEDASPGIGYGPYYRATEVAPDTLKWRPAIFMPRWVSRLTLEITSVRVQRLQEISAADACDEGVTDVLDPGHPLRSECYAKHGTWTGDERRDVYGPFAGSVAAFATLWDSINGKRDPWASNPWVWAISLSRVS